MVLASFTGAVAHEAAASTVYLRVSCAEGKTAEKVSVRGFRLSPIASAELHASGVFVVSACFSCRASFDESDTYGGVDALQRLCKQGAQAVTVFYQYGAKEKLSFRCSLVGERFAMSIVKNEYGLAVPCDGKADEMIYNLVQLFIGRAAVFYLDKFRHICPQ